ncbi:MAG: hypothetical protein AB7K67_06700 [Hyphomicrobiaceae bacterium]
MAEAEARRKAATEAEAARRAAAEADARRRIAAEAEERRRIAEEEKTLVGRLKKSVRDFAATIRKLPDEALAGLLFLPAGLLALLGFAFRLRSRRAAARAARDRSLRAAAPLHVDTAHQDSATHIERHQTGSLLETDPPVAASKEDEHMMTELGSSARRPDVRLGSVKVSGIKIHGTYATASSIVVLFGFFGWALVGIGILTALAGLAGGPQSLGLVLIPIGIVIVALGLMQVAAQQLLRASIDSADYARQSFLLQVALAEGRTDIDVS